MVFVITALLKWFAEAPKVITGFFFPKKIKYFQS